MRFVEVDLLGVYVAPIVVLMVIAYAIFYPLRRVATRFGWLARVWHPALFEVAVYLIILSTLVLVAGRLGTHA